MNPLRRAKRLRKPKSASRTTASRRRAIGRRAGISTARADAQDRGRALVGAMYVAGNRTARRISRDATAQARTRTAAADSPATNQSREPDQAVLPPGGEPGPAALRSYRRFRGPAAPRDQRGAVLRVPVPGRGRARRRRAC